MITNLLLTNGYVHSVTEPYANALHADNGVTAWLGSDEAGEQMVAATASGLIERRDLDGGLITPAFVDGFSTTPLVSDDARNALSSTVPTPRSVYYAPLDMNASDADGIYIAANQLDRLGEVTSGIKPPTQMLLESTEPQQLQHILSVLEQQPNSTLMRSRHRVLINHDISDEQISRLVEAHISVTLLPAIIDGLPVIYAPAAALLAAGVHVATGTGEWTGSIWTVLTALIEHQDAAQRISTRAAFNTVSRDGVRVWPSRIAQENMAAGQIAVGSPADFNVWRAQELGVQAPDVKAAHWSTDKRAGTALLPVLSSTGSAPTLELRIRDGQAL